MVLLSCIVVTTVGSVAATAGTPLILAAVSLGVTGVVVGTIASGSQGHMAMFAALSSIVLARSYLKDQGTFSGF
ncbi:17966_t:CDS:2 [Funneliformis geosporum]|uniref:17966_t:CDS:1 n=1 Tax=Funneliformis geosporum TaxID=1117311 RepID=A0A9W4T178_9GLOM|nr:17966_t:CDS:2 [Funneliformis geosporum]